MKANEYKIDISRVEQSVNVYLQKYDSRSLSSRRNHFWCINRFISFVKQNAKQEGECVVFTENLIVQWMSQIAKTSSRNSALQILASAYYFLQSIAETGVIQTNPMARIKTDFNKRGWSGLVWAFQSNNPQKRLTSLVMEPLFKGDFGKQAQSYIALHRAAGKKYRYSERLLIEFNRFIDQQGIRCLKYVTPKVIRKWLATMTCNQTSRRKKLCAMRLFFEHLYNLGIVKQNPVTVQTINAIGPRQYSFKPYLYSEEQINALLQQAGKIPCNKLFKLKPQVLSVVIMMLYTLGLRNGEALRLRIKDVNMKQGTLFIRNTKFYKDRIVPFGSNLGKHLQEYLDLRYRILLPVKPDDLLFVTNHPTAIGNNVVRGIFPKLLKAAGITWSKEQSRPRLHDLRHTFAVHRLLKWYKEGADVQSKLILLSTFMGHISIYSTQLYLTITLELLQEANKRFYNTFKTSFNGEVRHEA